MFNSKTNFLGIAPIGWTNDDLPELGAENTFQQAISEMALAGFTGTEIGNKYPADPAELKAALEVRGMRVASRWFSSFLLTRPFEETAREFVKSLDFLTAVGADRINVSEQSHSIQGQQETPVFAGKYEMSEKEWRALTEGLDRLGAMAAGRGVQLCYHHHMGTVVQTEAETDRLMAETDPASVRLCYDAGHFTFDGIDPVRMLQKHAGRVGHVHLKDVRLRVVEQAREKGWSFLTAVKNGAFTVPGDGDVDFRPVFEALAGAGYQGWLLVEAEQDPAKANPFVYAKKAREYIRLHTKL